MAVTVLNENGLYTFEGIKDPDEAFTLLSENSQNQGGAGSVNLDASQIKNKITPDELRKNKDWIEASRIMFRAKERREFTGKDEDLANWGLNSMAYFNYNLTFGTVPDAVSLRNAPDDQKKAFLFMMDTFDKTAYSWEGFGRGAKAVLTDPTTYVGAATFGFGTAAAKSAGFATKEALKAALRTGVVGAIEGGIYGGVQEGLIEKARVYADPNKDSVDWGKIGFGTAVGAAAGGVLGGLLPAGINRLAGRDVDPALARTAGRVDETPPVGAVEPRQLEMDLPDLNVRPEVGDAAAQARMDRITRPAGMPESATQQSLPMDMPVQRNLDQLPDFATPTPRETMSDMEARLMERWGIDNQLKLDLGEPPTGPYARAGQGDLFEGMPRMTAKQAEELKAARSKALDEGFDEAIARGAGTPEVKAQAVEQGEAGRATTQAKQAKPTKALPESPIADAYTTIEDLKDLLVKLGSDASTMTKRGIQQLLDMSSPLAQKLANMTPEQSRIVANEFRTMSRTDPQTLVLQSAYFKAERNLIDYIADANTELSNLIGTKATTDQLKQQSAKIMLANDALENVQKLANALSSNFGGGLVQSQGRVMKAGNRDKFIREYAVKNGLDINTPEGLNQATKAFLKDLDDYTRRTKIEAEIKPLKRELESIDATAPGGIDRIHDLQDKIMDLQRQHDLENPQNIPTTQRKVMEKVANAAGGLVLGPSSAAISGATNSLRFLLGPLQTYLGRGIFDEAAVRAMLHEYHTMWRLKHTAYNMGRLSFDLGQTIFLGKDGEFLKRFAKDHQLLNENTSYQFVEHHAINVFYKMLNATDEIFHVMHYHGIQEGDVVFNAYKRSQATGEDVHKLIKEGMERLHERFVNKDIDASIVTQIRRSGMQRGLRGDELRTWVNNTINNNKKYLQRANDELGIDRINDLYFRREFTGDNAISKAASWYEEAVRNVPALKLFGQLFFRTPVRVFEAGIRLTPGLNLATSPFTGNKFINDLTGKNGEARMFMAQGEMLMSYGIGMGLLLGYANGNITGSGGVGDYKVERHMGDSPNWRPYSIRIGDRYFSYRNFDPFATPLKIMTNFFETHQFALTTQRRVSADPETSMQAAGRTFLAAFNSVYGAVKDANLTSGIAELDRAARALSDPERNETAIQRFLSSKAQLAVPNVVRRGVKYFVEGADVSNDPKGWDQNMWTIINPASDQITHQYDALGNKRSNITQGFLGYMGFDISKPSRRGLSEQDQWSLNQVAALSYLTGKSFVPSPKPDVSFGLQAIGVTDMREKITSDGQSTMYNRAMEQFNKMWPEQAYAILKQTENMPVSTRKSPDLSKGITYRDEYFQKRMNDVWKIAVSRVMQNEMGLIERGRNELFRQRMDAITLPPQSAPFLQR